MCESGNVDSLWFSDRLVSKQPALEPVTALAATAGRTQRMKLGFNVVVLPHRDPLILAKECATIDYLSDGRLLAAFGVGQETSPEWRATGSDPAGRGARADEMLEVMTRLWREDEVTFKGRFYQFEQAAISPKPVQQPLPVWIGGSSPAAIRRTVHWGTGWLAGITPLHEVAEVVKAIKASGAESGRIIDPDHFGAGFPFRFGSRQDAPVQDVIAAFRTRMSGGSEEHVVAGGASEIIERVKAYVAVGVTKLILRPLATSDDDAMAQTELLMSSVIPTVHSM